MDPSESPAIKIDIALNQYEYRPIGPKGEMRILVLLPPVSPNDTELRCEIATANISDKPSYEAISYSWGAEVFPETLHVSDGILAITENLAAGLRRFRLKDRARRLWVDAVCINQHDDKEKGYQVALMAKIYRNAECVLVWLGEGSPDAHAGLECIRKLANSAWKFGLQYDEPTGSGLFDRMLEIQNKRADKTLEIVSSLVKLSSELDVVSIYAFVGQDWFERLWIVQEFVLASRVEIHNGQHVLSDIELFLAMALISLLMSTGLENADCLLMTVTLILNRYIYHNHLSDTYRHFLYYLSETRRRCKLDQDRVYGLLGLLPEGTGSFLEIDYELTAEEVYTLLALIYLRQNNIKILDYVGGVLSGSQSTNISAKEGPQGLARSMLPSWAPDWRVYRDAMAAVGIFTAATELSPRIFVSASNTNVIAIDGLYLDIIEMSLPANHEAKHLSLDEVITPPSGIARVVDFREIFTTKMMGGSYPTGEDQKLAFARCMLLDNKSTTSHSRLGTNLTTEKMLAMWEERYELFVNVNTASRSAETFNHTEDGAKDLRTDLYIHALFETAEEFSYFITKSGYIGVGPNNAMARDVVAIFSGASTPFVLRKVELDDSSQATPSLTGNPDGQRWRIVGHCYLHGFMDNEVASPEWG
ncbi:HET-domain-containing protein [Hyaloscypha hepaticicola]|uniref:HET-domain-containing protein n=1 Tax=Hyaloscypha hepaticicola TaxID=2082293 RepID=A0A2J6QIA7_9HELO|nr:HET-domain-containing protein [Hyaloscypha hepaticicola]